MDRGDVRLLDMMLPDPQNPLVTIAKRKWAVALQGGPSFARVRDVAVVLASTDRLGRLPRKWEVVVGQPEGFDHETIIDGRWVFTVSQARFDQGQYRTTLADAVMERISEAVVEGLQLF